MMPNQPPLILGVDGGGSKTTALLGNADGDILGRSTAGPSNYQVIGVEAAQAALRQAISAAFADANVSPVAPAALCLGLAGSGRAGDVTIFRAWATSEMPGTAVLVTTDVDLVLAAGAPAGWGVALICGTGSIACGKNATGRKARAGGWGYLLGDEGSAYAIGMAALRSVLRAFDGRAMPTALTEAILEQWDLPDPTALVSRIYGQGASPAAIAALAPLAATASASDQVAQRIISEAGTELGLAIQAVVRALDLPTPTPCALAGSLLILSDALQDALRRAVQQLGLELHPLTLVAEPAQGALRLAQELLTGGRASDHC